jgi:hypothetical protein
MATFAIDTNANRQKRLRVFDKVIIAVGIALLAAAFLLKGRAGEIVGGIFIIPFFVVFVSTSTANLLIKLKTRFVDINDSTIGFNTAIQTSAENQFPDTVLNWNEIKWIKKEKNNSISLYQESSFNKNFSLEAFDTDTQKSIMEELKKQAVARGISTVNF